MARMRREMTARTFLSNEDNDRGNDIMMEDDFRKSRQRKEHQHEKPIQHEYHHQQNQQQEQQEYQHPHYEQHIYPPRSHRPVPIIHNMNNTKNENKKLKKKNKETVNENDWTTFPAREWSIDTMDDQIFDELWNDKKTPPTKSSNYGQVPRIQRSRVNKIQNGNAYTNNNGNRNSGVDEDVKDKQIMRQRELEMQVQSQFDSLYNIKQEQQETSPTSVAINLPLATAVTNKPQYTTAKKLSRAKATTTATVLNASNTSTDNDTSFERIKRNERRKELPNDRLMFDEFIHDAPSDEAKSFDESMTILSSSPKVDETIELPSSSSSIGVINGKRNTNKDKDNYDINCNGNADCVTETHEIPLEASQPESPTRYFGEVSMINFEEEGEEERVNLTLAKPILQSLSSSLSFSLSSSTYPFIEVVAAIVMQTYIRRHLAQSQAWRRYESILILRDFARSFVLQGRGRRRRKEWERRIQSLDTEQMPIPSLSIHNRHRQTNHPTDLSMLIQSSIKIQAVFRGWWTRDNMVVDKFCASMIQRNVRSYLNRMCYRYDRYRVIVVQSVVRKFIVLEERRKDDKAVVRIQALWRGFSTEKKFIVTLQKLIQDEDERNAATIIQSHFRSFHAQSEFIHSLADILLVQTICRRFLVQVKVMPTKRAVCIQDTDAVIVDEYSHRRERRRRTLLNAGSGLAKEGGRRRKSPTELDTNELVEKWRLRYGGKEETSNFAGGVPPKKNTVHPRRDRYRGMSLSNA